MIEIILRDTGERLDLPRDVKIGIELNNPMFATNGDFSLPLALPITEKNTRILNFPTWINTNTLTLSFEVLVNYMSYQKKGILKILSYNENSINICILFDNTLLYQKIKDKTMESVFEGIKWIRSSIESWIYDFQLKINNPDAIVGDYPFEIFTVITHYYAKDGENMIIDNDRSDSTTYLNQMEYDENQNKWFLFGRNPYTFTDDEGSIINYPKGYCITPFLRLHWVLQKIFEYFGFEFKDEDNFFAQNDMNKLCLLNNTIDSLMTTDIYAKVLVPDCSVIEFMDVIRNRFGCEFYIDSNLKNVKMSFYKDIFTAIPENYTDKLGSKISLEYAEKQQLKLTCNHTNPLNYKDIYFTSNDYFKNYTYKGVLPKSRLFSPYTGYSTIDFSNTYPYNSWNVGDCFLNFLDKRFVRITNIQSLSGNQLRIQFVSDGYDNLDFYDKQSDFKEKELKTVYSDYPTIIQQSWIGNRITMPFINGFRNKTTNIIVTDSEGNKTTKSEDNTCPVSFAYNIILTSGERPRPYGSSHIYVSNITNNNFYNLFNIEKINAINNSFATEDGLYEHFFKEYNDALRKGMHKMKCKINLTEREINDYDFYKMKIIDGIRY
ncbi:MAG: hypothetical protein LBS50_04650, partial [Prevotellaceae bacterium]|nr:hypothetical protein [Prevotellaceae bacterium]